MNQADVEENRCHQAPDFALIDSGIVFHPECHQGSRIHRTACQRHQNEDCDVRRKKCVSERRAEGPDRMQEFKVIFFNHKEGDEIIIPSNHVEVFL